MVRNQFSYWLRADPAGNAVHATQEVLDALLGSNLAHPDGPMVFGLDGTGVQGEVDPGAGTVEEVDGLPDLMDPIAAMFPDFDFCLDENDEMDKSNAATTKWSAGRRVFEGCRRTVDPGEYDEPTVAAIADYLDAAGWTDAATAVRAGKFAV